MQRQYKSFTEIGHLPWEKPFLSVYQAYFTDDAFKNVLDSFTTTENPLLNLKYLKKWT